ncbi:MAG: biopolymer transporter ExbD [Candidatus Latescibacteria bacterium]|nr:biopolymer transporter ExbD [Candidatus Latescibacterota bacterium]
MAKRRIGIAIDMTPMVDVAFLLLIFFMTTTQFKPPEKVGVQLPGSKSEIHVPETRTIILTVNAAGEIYISDENLSQTQQVAMEDLVSAIVTWRSKNRSAVVVVKGDKDAEYGAVADVMNALAESQTLRFNLMTDLKVPEKKGKKRSGGSKGH